MVVDDTTINQTIIDELSLYTKWLVRKKELRYPTYADTLIKEYLKDNDYRE